MAHKITRLKGLRLFMILFLFGFPCQTDSKHLWEQNDEQLLEIEHSVQDTATKLTKEMVVMKSEMLWKEANIVLTHLYSDQNLAEYSKTILKTDSSYEHDIKELAKELTEKVINPIVPSAITLELAKPDRDLQAIMDRVDAIELKFREISTRQNKIQSQMYIIIGREVKTLAEHDHPDDTIDDFVIGIALCIIIILGIALIVVKHKLKSALQLQELRQIIEEKTDAIRHNQRHYTCSKPRVYKSASIKPSSFDMRSSSYRPIASYHVHKSDRRETSPSGYRSAHRKGYGAPQRSPVSSASVL